MKDYTKIYNVLSLSGFSDEIIAHVVSQYQTADRHYHDIRHITEMLDYVEKQPVWDKLEMDVWLRKDLQIAIIFHDIVYDVTSKTNEENSSRYFMNLVKDVSKTIYAENKFTTERLSHIHRLIMATKEHKFTGIEELTMQLIIKADLDRFNGPIEKVWGHTLELMKEYCQYDYSDFNEGRIKFLTEYAQKMIFMGPEATGNIISLINIMKTWRPKIAIYPGSFNPLHVGHRNILEKASKIFDKVIVAVGVNPDKPAKEYQIPDEINKLYQVDYYDCMLTEYIATKKYPVTVIRGLRNASDLQGEITYYRFLQDLDPNINVISIFCDREDEHISSSAIKALKKNLPPGTKTQYEV